VHAAFVYRKKLCCYRFFFAEDERDAKNQKNNNVQMLNDIRLFFWVA